MAGESNSVNANLSPIIYSQAIRIVDKKVKESCTDPKKENIGWKKDKPNIFGYRPDRRNDSPECTENKNWYNNLQIDNLDIK